jgi:hypothetical protein
MFFAICDTKVMSYFNMQHDIGMSYYILRHNMFYYKLRYDMSYYKLRHDMSYYQLRHDMSYYQVRHDMPYYKLRLDISYCKPATQNVLLQITQHLLGLLNRPMFYPMDEVVLLTPFFRKTGPTWSINYQQVRTTSQEIPGGDSCVKCIHQTWWPSGLCLQKTQPPNFTSPPQKRIQPRRYLVVNQLSRHSPGLTEQLVVQVSLFYQKTRPT